MAGAENEFKERSNHSYNLIEDGGRFQILSRHPTKNWELSIIARPHPLSSQPEKDALEIYFRGIDEITHTISIRDIPSMDSTDRGFMEEFADRYAPRFQKLAKVKDSGEAFEKVFLDIFEYREKQWKKDREEWLNSWKSLRNSK